MNDYQLAVLRQTLEEFVNKSTDEVEKIACDPLNDGLFNALSEIEEAWLSHSSYRHVILNSYSSYVRIPASIGEGDNIIPIDSSSCGVFEWAA